MTLSRRKINRIVLSCCFVVAVFFSPVVAAEPAVEFAGAYAGKLIWEGTVVMRDDVLILAGGELIIRPGTQVRVIPAEGTKIDPEYLSPLTELLVRGSLDIQGTVAAPVRFVIAGEVKAEEPAWAGITLDHAAPSRIANAEIVSAECGILTVASSPEIVGNTITASRYGIVAQAQSQPKIIGNSIRAGGGGVFCWENSNPYLKDNTLSGLDEEGVFVDATSRPVLERNTITGNDIGLALYPRDLPYDLTLVQGNRQNLRWLGSQGQTAGQP